MAELCRELALRQPQTFEELSEFLSGRPKVFLSGACQNCSSGILVTQHCDPPYRAIGYSYTYRI